MGVYEENFRNEKSERIIARLAEIAEDLGLLYRGGGFVVPPEYRDQPDPPVFLQAVFLVGEKAFDASTLANDPEQTRIDKEFESLMGRYSDPTSDVVSQMQQAAKNGKDMFDLDFDDEDLKGLTDE